MLTPDHSVSEFALPALDARAVTRRVLLPAGLACVAAIAVFVLGGHVHAFADAVRRGLGVNAGWAAIAVVFECVSLASYAGLLSLVAGRATPRVGARESAQITLAGAAATRLLPTAGAGGVALTLWALHRAGLRPRAATRTLLVFLIVLYSVFLISIVLSGAVLTLGLVDSRGPLELSAIPAVAAMLGITLCLALASRHGRRSAACADSDMDADVRTCADARVDADAHAAADANIDVPAGAVRGRRARVMGGARMLGSAVGEACWLLRSGDARLAGAVAYWAFDAAVVWAMLHAFGAPPVLPVIVLAYFVGQVANTLPVPGSVSGGMAGVLIAFGVPAGLALPAVLAYRGVAVWLPSPVAITAVPALRSTIARWRREDDLGSSTRLRVEAVGAGAA